MKAMVAWIKAKMWWFLGGALVLAAAVGAWTFIPPTYAVRLEIQESGPAVVTHRETAHLIKAVEAHLEWMGEQQVVLAAQQDELEDQWDLSLTDLGLQPPLEQVEEQILAKMQSVRWYQRIPGIPTKIHLDLPLTWDRKQLEAALAEVRFLVDEGPRSARMTKEGDQVVVVPEVMGIAVDADALVAMLDALLADLRPAPAGEAVALAGSHPVAMQVPTMTLEPYWTREGLKKAGVRRLVAEWSTYYNPYVPRAENVERAAEAFNGLMLAPGEVVSYNETVGPIDAESGWKNAPVIENGELVPGIGGGVCQTATTFYGAALRANLDIVERHPHQLAIGYVPPSQDAVIAQGWADLKLRNPTDGYLLIETVAQGGTVTFRIYGDEPEGQEVKVESRVLGSGDGGLVSEAYRSVYQDGELIKRERLSQDRYGR